ncbi:hypothetical protein GCM10020331_066790 [Ectobacillus funiculus]
MCIGPAVISDTFRHMRLAIYMLRSLSEAMLKDIPNFDQLLLDGNIAPVRSWLTEHIHRYGKTQEAS